MGFEKFLSEKITYYDPETFFSWLDEHLTDVRTVKDVKKIRWFNCAAAFDIETSSFYDKGEKRACMYLWAFGVNGGCLYGRTWGEFISLCNNLSDILGLDDHRHFIVYVHNLAYEFQWIRKRFEWENVFAVKDRKPVKALTKTGIEFRCSYLMSGYSLDYLGKQLKKYVIQKAVGDLNYSLIRTSETPISEKELHYQANDVRVVMAYIQEQIETEKYITNIPITKTGYVRRYCRENCLYIPHSHHKLNRSYKTVINALTLTVDVYDMLKRAFAGGFTHANAFYVQKTVERVSSYDFTSSYPAVMVAKKYPMGPAQEYKPESIDDFRKQLNLYCCLFDIEFKGLYPRLFYDHPISRSKCFICENAEVDNGRIVTADRIILTITEQDFFIYETFYSWESVRVGKMYRFQRGYLPTEFIRSILKLYKDKTTLKGVSGKETEYLVSKEMLNSCYGMAVTDIVRDEITYIDEWSTAPPDKEKAIERYNNGKNRFLFYAWGVWVTAHARRALFSGIESFGSDYVYSDTDSIKAINGEKHADYIERYNKNIIQELENACEYHGISKEDIRPKTIKGVEKPLGVWDFEGVYDMFKTLGAKRYLTVKNGELNLTISGVNKKTGSAFLIKKYGGDLIKIFNAFDDGLYFDGSATGKMTHTYIDEEIAGIVKDYTGHAAEYHELSCVHLEPADYSLSMFKLFLDYLKGVRYE